MYVNCVHFRETDKTPRGAGRCAKNYFKDPSFGSCMIGCQKRERIHPDDSIVKVQHEERPSPTLQQAGGLLRAIITGRYVPDAAKTERESICIGCDRVRADKDGLWCSLCGCRLTSKSKIDNLSAYEEIIQPLDSQNPLPLVKRVTQGCKHPDRENGKGWPVRTVLSLHVLP
jgi:hypothetical protein